MAARVSMMAFVALLIVCLAASANVASASHAPEQLRLSLTGKPPPQTPAAALSSSFFCLRSFPYAWRVMRAQE